jgi:hypothetical protein
LEEAVPADMADEARSHGADVVAWWLVRSGGATVEQAAVLAGLGPAALVAAAVAERASLATCDEVARAALGVSAYAYLAARELGLDHDGAQLVAGSDLGAFEMAAERFGQAEVLGALAEGLGPADYAALRRQLQAQGLQVALTAASMPGAPTLLRIQPGAAP